MRHIEHTGISVAADNLIADWQFVSKLYSDQQINLRKPANMSDHQAVLYGAGSLYRDGKMWESEKSWTEYNHLFKQLYTCRRVGPLLEDIADDLGGKLGRLRYMVMEPKSCLTYHIDPDNVCRLHIPIITSDGAMFINDRTVDVMDQPGSVYIFNSTVKHTAVNASRERRVHLVGSVYK